MGKNKNKSVPFRKRPNFQFDRNGSFKKSKRNTSGYEQNSASPDTAETVYRLLCPGRKIGSVIGKGGDIIKAMRDETGAKIKIDEAVPGTDERVIIVFSSSTRKPRTQNTTEDLNGKENENENENENEIKNEDENEDEDEKEKEKEEEIENENENRSEMVIEKENENESEKEKEKENENESEKEKEKENENESEKEKDKENENENEKEKEMENESEKEKEKEHENESEKEKEKGKERVDEKENEIEIEKEKEKEDENESKNENGNENNSKIENENENKNENPTEKEPEKLEAHCSAQDALLKVHDRIAEDEDLYGGMGQEDNNEDNVVTARLLVPSNQVGCLLGKGGHIIQKLRSDTGANIRILPAEHLPACALRTDELVQISGISAVVRRALYEISTLLHQNPRPPMNNPMSAGGQGFHPPAPRTTNMMPQGNPVWPNRSSSGRAPPPMPWAGPGRYGNEPSGFVPGGFNGVPPGMNGKTSDEFCMKILCSAERIGGVIGKGGSNVKQVQQETRTNIHVEDTSPESDERAILVSSTDVPWNPRSPTIDAILLLQSKTSEISEKGITTRLLVPSNKVGCLLGQGGHIITEMRRRSRADIRIISKDGKPKCASADEELVQICGNINVARDALLEVASRLRMRSLEGVNAPAEPGPMRPFQGFGHPEGFFERGPPPSRMVGAGSSGGYGHAQGGGYDYEPQHYPAQPTATPGYPNINSSVEVKTPNSAVGSALAAGGSNISNIGQMSGAKVKLNDPSSGTECVVEIHGSSEQMNAAQNYLQAYTSSAGQNYNFQQQVPQQLPQQAPQPLPQQAYQPLPQQVQVPPHIPQQHVPPHIPQQHVSPHVPQHHVTPHIQQQVQAPPQVPHQIPQQGPYQY